MKETETKSDVTDGQENSGWFNLSGSYNWVASKATSLCLFGRPSNAAQIETYHRLLELVIEARENLDRIRGIQVKHEHQRESFEEMYYQILKTATTTEKVPQTFNQFSHLCVLENYAANKEKKSNEKVDESINLHLENEQESSCNEVTPITIEMKIKFLTDELESLQEQFDEEKEALEQAQITLLDDQDVLETEVQNQLNKMQI